MTDFTGTSKRLYLVTSIRNTIDKLDDVELAVVLAWLKSGGIYQHANMLGALHPQEMINEAQRLNEESQAAEEAKRAEENARKHEEAQRKAEEEKKQWKKKLLSARK